MLTYAVLTVFSGVFLLFFISNFYRGMNDSLADSTIGNVYNFRYFQPLNGTDERVLAKVIAKRDMKDYISRLNSHSKYRKWDRDFVRSNTLVTCVLPNGSIRNFYAERVSDCHKSLFGRLLYSTGMACMF